MIIFSKSTTHTKYILQSAAYLSVPVEVSEMKPSEWLIG